MHLHAYINISNINPSRTRLHLAVPLVLRGPCPHRSSHGPALGSRSRASLIAPKSGSEPLPSLVEQLLRTPGLEAPEGSSPEQMLKVYEAFWKAMKDPKMASKPAPTVITEDITTALSSQRPPEFDVCVAGGTLGIFLALPLQLRGHKVCIVERRQLQGRTQEWNISRRELDNLVEQGLLTQAELENCIETAWEFDRIGFKGGSELWISDVLNIGVSPRKLIAAMKDRFLESGGALYESTAFKSAVVHSDGVLVQLMPGAGGVPITPADVNRPTAINARETVHSSSNGTAAENGTNGAVRAAIPRNLTSRLLVDCMGHYSPIVKQMRNGQKPDGMVIVVGGAFVAQNPASSAPIFPQSADLLYSFTDSFDDSQLFWEAFPAEGGAARTTYAFQYSDVHPERPSFATLLNTFLKLLPQYQGVALSDIAFKRILFGGFPCYMKGSPLPPAFDRVLQIGDAAAIQSPLSFGGFGAMVRHLPRLSRGVDDALRQHRLSRRDLGWLQPYQPSLSAAWLFQRSMSVGMGQLKEENSSKKSGWLAANHINRLLKCNFSVMRVLGDRVLRPFVQDALQVGPLALTMLGMMLRDPITVTTVLFQTGPLMILNWFRHFFALVAATAVYVVLKPFRGVFKNYTFQRILDAVEYGSASDYKYYPGKMLHGDEARMAERMEQHQRAQEELDSFGDSGGESDGANDEGQSREPGQQTWPVFAT